MASFVDRRSLKEAFIVRANVRQTTTAIINASQAAPIGGTHDPRGDATSWAYGLSLLWRPPSRSARLATPLCATILTSSWMFSPTSNPRRQRFERGLPIPARARPADIVLMPPECSTNTSTPTSRELPDGHLCADRDYKVGRLTTRARISGGISAVLGSCTSGRKNVLKPQPFFGATFNTENEDTDYQSGTQAFIDGTWHNTPLAWRPRGWRRVRVLLQQVKETAGRGDSGRLKARRSASVPSYRT